MIKAASLPIEIDLLSLSQFLRKQGLAHRINEESGQQVIWVNSEQEVELVTQILASWPMDRQTPNKSSASIVRDSVAGIALWRPVLNAFIASPVTLSLIAACLLVAAVSALGTQVGRVQFLFYPLLETDNFVALVADISSIDLFLRTVTPMFLHFGELHLVFNMLWLWYFGKQLEAIHPLWIFVVLIVVISFVSNTTQYLYTGYNNFGGMSGVVYGLVGYTWVIHSFMPRSYLLLNNRMFVVFVVALVLMELVAGSWVATAAHVGGLVCGLFLGTLIVIYYRLVLRQEVVGSARKQHQ